MNPFPILRQTICACFAVFYCGHLSANPQTSVGRPYQPETVDPLEIPWTWIEVEKIENGKDLRCFNIGHDGKIWLGYHNQIASYDGVTQKTYPEVSSNYVQSIDVTSDGSIFLTFENELWRGDGTAWMKYEQPIQVLRTSETGVREAPDGKLWIASGTELILIEPNELRAMGNVADNSIADFDIDRQGRFWLTESPSGDVRSLRFESGRFVEENEWPGLMKPPASVSRNSLHETTDILCGHDGSVWVVNLNESVPPKHLKPGASSWIEHDLTLHKGTNQNGSISQTKDGVIRITGKGAIHRYSENGWQVYIHERLRLSANWAHIKEGPDGSVWILERFRSVSRIDYDGRKWRIFEGLFYQDESPDGSKWFLGDNNTLVQWQPLKDAWTEYRTEDGIIDEPTSMFAQNDNRVWAIGSHRGIAAVSLWDGKTWSIMQFPELGPFLVHRIHAETKNGSLLVVGKRTNKFGLPISGQPFALVSPENKTLILEIPDSKVFSADPLPDGRIALAGIHIYTIDEGRVERLLGEERKTLDFRFLHHLKAAPNGDLWVSNWREGIARLKDKQWDYFKKEIGGGDAYVADLEMLSDGGLAALTSNGLLRYNDGEWHTLQLPGFESISDSSTLSQSSDGAIWANVEAPFWQRSPQKGKRTLKTLRYLPGKLPPETTVALLLHQDPYSRSRRVSWSGTNHGFEGSTRLLDYSYRVDQEGWSPYSKEETAYLENLKPGIRRIEVRSRDSDGNVDPTPAVLEFKIRIPFWETDWFLGSLIAVAIAIATLIYGLLLQRYRHVAALDRMRMHFLTNISHELRTPLTLIAGPLEALVSRSPRGSESERDASMALRNARRLSELIDQLLELRKAEAKPLPGLNGTYELVSFVRTIASDFDKLAQTVNQRVEYCSNTETSWLTFDKDAYRKILDNLILNALKHSDPGSVTRIDLVTETGDQPNTQDIRVSVSDEGNGIPQNSLPLIFDPFYTDKSSSLPGVRSFGIGLALVKELVDIHNGTIEAESPIQLANGEQGGARFTIHFRNVPQSGPHAGSVASDAPPAEDASRANKDPSQPIILVVDDNSDIRSFLSKELGQTFQVIEAKDGQSASDLAQQIIPDLILADVMMPGLTGIELCQKLKQIDATSHIPIILQTASANQQTRQAGIDSGAIDYISKPFSIEALRRKIENLLSNRKQFAKHLKIQLLTPSDEEKTDTESVFVARIQEILDSHISDPGFNAVSLATELGMSQRSCHRKFTATLDSSPGEFIKNYRLEKSLLLLERGASASDAAETIAYSDLRAYTRAFKKRFGCTPADYKKRKSKSN